MPWRPWGWAPSGPQQPEAYLKGRELTEAVMARAGELALENANPRSNPLRGSREYRLEALPVIIRRTLEACRAQLS